MKRTCDIFKYEQAIVENLNWTLFYDKRVVAEVVEVY